MVIDGTMFRSKNAIKIHFFGLKKQLNMESSVLFCYNMNIIEAKELLYGKKGISKSIKMEK